jgi:hypothetical protein
MQCRNCKNTLSGDEDFCPRCGIPQKLTDISSHIKNISDSTEKNPLIEEKGSIFQNEPVYIYTDPPKESSSKKSKAATVFVSLFIITLLIIGAVTLTDYFGLVPAISELFVTENIGSINEEDLSQEEPDTILGVIAPDINLRVSVYTVSAQNNLPLRKGPDNSYALIDTVSYGTDVQLIGKTLQNNIWGYVYIPSLDYYGWLMCSYLSDNFSEENPDQNLTKSESTTISE